MRGSIKVSIAAKEKRCLGAWGRVAFVKWALRDLLLGSVTAGPVLWIDIG